VDLALRCRGQLRDGTRQCRAVAVPQHHRRPRGDHALRRSEADAAGAPGDDSDPPVEIDAVHDGFIAPGRRNFPFGPKLAKSEEEGMELKYSGLSPYVRKVMVVAHEAGGADRMKLTPVKAREEPETVVPFNPLGKIPALVLDDG